MSVILKPRLGGGPGLLGTLAERKKKIHATRLKPICLSFTILITVRKEVQGIDRKRKITNGQLNLYLIVYGSCFIKGATSI
jgi:hypothetical protein